MSENLPEPGTIEDLSLGEMGEAEPLPDEEPDEPIEVNEDDEEEDR